MYEKAYLRPSPCSYTSLHYDQSLYKCGSSGRGAAALPSSAAYPPPALILVATIGAGQAVSVPSSACHDAAESQQDARPDRLLQADATGTAERPCS
ncbi:MAG: hypothetical protein M1819_004584 [Sarea resinae]|nr:MAG: hypothetical protein M1819_006812 [Sarea resinae]KAI9832040.1 MAG: hypothetical protein M1819_004584 [Sarea resinae]